jgi:hypothetical protein
MTGSSVLVIAQHADSTAERVIEALRRRGIEPACVDLADVHVGTHLVGRPGHVDGPGSIFVDGDEIVLSDVRAVYRWHPARFAFPSTLSGPERRFATLESVAGWGGVLSAQPWRWLDAPSSVADAAYKPKQIAVAAQSGMQVPMTIVTDVGDAVREFAAEVGGPIVYKSLSTGLVAECDELKIVYTSMAEVAEIDDAALGLCSHMFQQWVPKSHDVRLTVVGDHFFGVAVRTNDPHAFVDWRSRYDELRYESCAVPEPVRQAVRTYLDHFDLSYSAFDFSVTPDGAWWFLEGNASGQWEWLADQCGLPIAGAIADELIAA